jgi:hypothetical protein
VHAQCWTMLVVMVLLQDVVRTDANRVWDLVSAGQTLGPGAYLALQLIILPLQPCSTVLWCCGASAVACTQLSHSAGRC